MTCSTGKIVYADKRAAVETARHVQRQHRKTTLPDAYQCPECGAWHLGSQRRTGRAR